jgi:hypothetical protein
MSKDFSKISLDEAIAWTDKNCLDSVCTRLKSRAVARRLAFEVKILEQTNQNLIEALYDEAP